MELYSITIQTNASGNHITVECCSSEKRVGLSRHYLISPPRSCKAGNKKINNTFYRSTESVMWPRLFPELMTQFTEPCLLCPAPTTLQRQSDLESTKWMNMGIEEKRRMLICILNTARLQTFILIKISSKLPSPLSCLGSIIRRHSPVFSTQLA